MRLLHSFQSVASAQRIALWSFVGIAGVGFAGSIWTDGSSEATSDDHPLTAVPTATIEGAVRSEGGEAVGGGRIEVAGGPASAPKGAAIAKDGTYRLSGIAAGTYRLRLHPNHAYSIAPGQPDPVSVTVASGETVRMDFSVQQAEWYDDFQDYESIEDFRRRFATGVGPKGDRRAPLYMINSRNEDVSRYEPTTATLAIDPTAGPDGKQTLRVSFEPRNDPGKCGTTNAAVGVRWPPPGPQNDEWWLRFVSKEGDAASGEFWVNGHSECREFRSYKFILWHVPDMWGLAVEAEVFKHPGQADWFLSILPAVGRRVYPPGHRQGGSDGLNTRDWSGVWHTWHFHYDATRGTDEVVLTIYRDGEVFIRTGPASYNTRLKQSPGTLLMLALGANINAGPHQKQRRWFREAGVYRSRPSFTMGPME